ncbi:unnamed protein product [Caenorhabditis auriculariae]|uniref:non-specific serine/threonine protein kinase n=1 Tax=Caenorhabditis auriculariae TaxID=2777116 RepID=A0A8S1HBN8_9PELO|nr:unnamed protein product [Caenorhabditis auriculariae]
MSEAMRSRRDDPTFSTELATRLAELIRAHPCVWDYSSADFADRRLCDAAWKQVCSDANVNEIHVRSLWNTLWNRFSTMQAAHRNPLFLRLSGCAEKLEVPLGLAGFDADEEARSSSDSLDNSPAKTVSDLESEQSRSSTPSTPSRSPKKVSWALFDQVSLSGEEFLLPRRFEAIELLTAGPSTKISCVAADLHTSENVTIRKVSLRDAATMRREYRNILLGRLLPHPNILNASEAYEVASQLYLATEQMDGRLSDIVEERLNHFVVAKIAHQILAAVAMLHSNCISHGDLTLNTILVNTDAELKLATYGNGDDSTECLGEKFRDDLLSVGAILSRFLMEEDEMFKFSKSKNHKDIDWRVVLEGNTDSGLLDYNARSLLFQLLDGRKSARELLQHPYFKSFRAPAHATLERRHTVVGQKNPTELLETLREELNRFNPFNMSELHL